MKRFILLLILCLLVASLSCSAIAAEGRSAKGREDLLPNDIYVTEGLQLFLCAMPGYEDTVSLRNGGGTWQDLLGRQIALPGDTWRKGAEGGLGFRMTLRDFQSGKDGGLLLDGLLPGGSYSIETVMSPVGLTNADGSRYKELVATYGITMDMAFALGPFKTLTGVSLRGEGVRNHALENRWYYHGKGGWHDANCIVRIIDESLCTKSPSDVISYNIYHKKTGTGASAASAYRIYQSGVQVGTFSAAAGTYAAPENTEGYFRLMHKFPADFYAVRVYDRELTQEERYQNHAADLFAFYQIDTELLSLTRYYVGDSASLYQPFAAVGFDLTQEEAEAQVNAILSEYWIRSLGSAVRLDNRVGLRGVYAISPSAVAFLEEQGYSLEIGVGFAPGVVRHPSECDTVITAYESNVGKNVPFFLNETDFALSVEYVGEDAELFHQEISFLGFLRIYGEEGELVCEILSPTSVNGDAVNAYRAYKRAAEGSYQNHTFVKNTLQKCYLKEHFYVAEWGSDLYGDGSEDRPYQTAERAQRALKQAMVWAEGPTDFLLHFMEGTHRLTSPLQFTNENYENGDFRLRIVGDGAEETVLTGAVEMTDGWADVPGKPYYVYQFDRGQNGAYPFFRHFYADGEMATLAYNGPNRAKDGNQYVTPYNRNHNNPTNAPKIYLAEELFRGVDPGEYNGIELNINGQWCFNIVRVSRVDMADKIPSLGLVAVYIHQSDYDRMMAPNGNYQNRTYWLENCLSFLDEPGEYYYDKNAGRLYYYPLYDQEPEDVVCEYAAVENLLSFSGMEDVSVSHLTLTGVGQHSSFLNGSGYFGSQAGGSPGPYSAVIVRDCTSFTLEECIITEVAGDALQLHGRLSRIRVLSNRLWGIGATALRLGNFSISQFTEENSIRDLVAEDNDIDGTGLFRRESCAIMLSEAKGAKILNNTIRHSSYSAISVGVHKNPAPDDFEGEVYHLRDIEIAYNYITDFVTDMRDGAAIYTLGGNSPKHDHSYFNTIHHNVILWSKITGDIHGKAHTTGLYNDNHSSNWHDYQNVQILHPDRWWSHMYFHYVQADQVHDILIEDNYYAGIPKVLPSGVASQYQLIYFNINGAKRIFEANTYYCNDPEDLPMKAKNIIHGAGSSYYPADFDYILSGEY